MVLTKASGCLKIWQSSPGLCLERHKRADPVFHHKLNRITDRQQKDRQAGRQRITDRQSERERETERQRETDKQPYRQSDSSQTKRKRQTDKARKKERQNDGHRQTEESCKNILQCFDVPPVKNNLPYLSENVKRRIPQLLTLKIDGPHQGLGLFKNLTIFTWIMPGKAQEGRLIRLPPETKQHQYFPSPQVQIKLT